MNFPRRLVVLASLAIATLGFAACGDSAKAPVSTDMHTTTPMQPHTTDGMMTHTTDAMMPHTTDSMMTHTTEVMMTTTTGG